MAKPPTNRISRPLLESGLYGPLLKIPPRMLEAKNAPTMHIIPSSATRTFVNMSVSLPEAQFPQATKRDRILPQAGDEFETETLPTDS